MLDIPTTTSAVEHKPTFFSAHAASPIIPPTPKPTTSSPSMDLTGNQDLAGLESGPLEPAQIPAEPEVDSPKALLGTSLDSAALYVSDSPSAARKGPKPSRDAEPASIQPTKGPLQQGTRAALAPDLPDKPLHQSEVADHPKYSAIDYPITLRSLPHGSSISSSARKQSPSYPSQHAIPTSNGAASGRGNETWAPTMFTSDALVVKRAQDWATLCVLGLILLAIVLTCFP